jgi:hypothetical protein
MGGSSILSDDGRMRSGTYGVSLNGRRSPLFMSQMAHTNFDSIKTSDLLVDDLDSRSHVRKRCFRLKYKMIESPLRAFVTNIVAGFIFNLPFICSIIILYEKVSNSPPTITHAFLVLGKSAHLWNFFRAYHRTAVRAAFDRIEHYLLPCLRPTLVRVCGLAP